jgi:hypothetical protein
LFPIPTCADLHRARSQQDELRRVGASLDSADARQALALAGELGLHHLRTHEQSRWMMHIGTGSSPGHQSCYVGVGPRATVCWMRRIEKNLSALTDHELGVAPAIEKRPTAETGRQAAGQTQTMSHGACTTSMIVATHRRRDPVTEQQSSTRSDVHGL